MQFRWKLTDNTNKSKSKSKPRRKRKFGFCHEQVIYFRVVGWVNLSRVMA